MPINVELLKKTLAHIEAEPDAWKQSEWRCGTSCCFAGHAARLAGAKWAGRKTDNVRKGRLVEHVRDYAERVLDLDFYQTERLFSGQNSLADLRNIVAELVAEAEAAS